MAVEPAGRISPTKPPEDAVRCLFHVTRIGAPEDVIPFHPLLSRPLGRRHRRWELCALGLLDRHRPLALRSTLVTH